MDQLPSDLETKRMPSSAVPGWAVARGTARDEVEAAFMAGAALITLDNVVRSEPMWAGAWRQRLALKSAVAAVRLAGRGEDEAALRDAWHLRQSDDQPGPAGNILAAWRRLASRSAELDDGSLRVLADLLAIRWSDDLAAIPEQIHELGRSANLAPFAAAGIARQVFAQRPDAELLAWWCADLVLAQRLGWRRAVPLLMAQVWTAAFRPDGARATRIRPGDKGFERGVCLAVAQAAVEACRLGDEMGRRGDRLVAVAPRLRAKGARDAIDLLLGDDAVSGSLVTKNLSRFASRRLFQRLLELEAVRELSGRPTFRLFGI